VADEVAAVSALSAHRQAAPSGRLRVSMPGEVANLLLADSLAAFVALHPGITLELDLSPRRVDLLGEGFDLAVRIGDLPDDGLLAARQLKVLSTGLYASPDYLAGRGQPAVPDDLMRHEAVRLPTANGDPTPWSLRHGEKVWEGLPPGRLMANSPELLVRLARAGAGIASVPDDFALPDVRRGVLQRVLPQWCTPAHTAWAVFPGRKLMPTKTRAFIDMLRVALGAPEA
jgi:DNA-binding transcriptional LysR family regulator